MTTAGLKDDVVDTALSSIGSSNNVECGHPIHHLAAEILGEIFIHCLPSPSNPVSSEDPPLLFLQVCRYWRQTASTTPRLWTDVNLGKKLLRDTCSIFQMWLDNAGSLPLQVKLPRYSTNATQAEAVLELVLNNFHRILELEGSLTPGFSTFLLKHSLPIQAPYLRRLDVGGWDKLPSPQALERLRGCMIVPQLQICALNSTRFQFSLLSFDPTRLRELSDLWVMDVAEFESMEILSSFTNLETLTIYLNNPVDASLMKFPPRIPIPSLRNLSIGIFPDYKPELFLKALDVPLLEHLTIGPTPIIGLLLDTLMGETLPPLKSLHLFGHNITASVYIPWISKFRQLEKLTLHRGTLDLEVLASLTCDDSRRSDLDICPLLSTMHFKLLRLPWEAIEDMIRSRAPKGDADGGLRNVIFEGCDGFDDDQPAFAKIIEESRGLLEIRQISNQVSNDSAYQV